MSDDDNICYECLSEPCKCKKKDSHLNSRRTHPDTITNDYIYVRGDWDYLGKLNRTEVLRYHDRYVAHIKKVRAELGLVG